MAIFSSHSNLCKKATVTQLLLNRDLISQGMRALHGAFHSVSHKEEFKEDDRIVYMMSCTKRVRSLRALTEVNAKETYSP